MNERRANPYGYTEARNGRWIEAAMAIFGIGMALSAVWIIGLIIYRVFFGGV